MSDARAANDRDVAAPRCADAAEAEADPLAASAPPVEQWVLVEHPGPWGRRALTDSGLDPKLTTALSRWAHAVSGRATLIRRTGRARVHSGPRRWYRVDSRPGREGARVGSFAAQAELLDVLDDPAAGHPSDEPLYLVCTHGRRDTCCAVRGRPVAAALAAAYPDRTWECTHLGGDRFAANVVVLPHGFYYGHVPPAAAADVAQRHEAGLIEPRYLRGRASLPPAVQAAQHHARASTGDTSIAAFPPLEVHADDPEHATVRLGTPDGAALEVTVRAYPHVTGRPLTCSATRPGVVTGYELVDLGWVSHRKRRGEPG